MFDFWNFSFNSFGPWLTVVSETADKGGLLCIQKFCILSQGIKGDTDNIEAGGEKTFVVWGF